MKPRLNPYQAAPNAMKALATLEAQVAGSGLDPRLAELVKVRASQINGCVFCLNMHTHDARSKGESEERLYLLNAWRESPLYTAHERAALAWTEAVTLVSETHVPDAVYDDVRAEFEPEELVKLTLLITTINAWNRFAVSFRSIHPVRAQAAAA